MADLRGFWKDKNAGVGAAKYVPNAKNKQSHKKHKKPKQRKIFRQPLDGEMLGRFVGSQTSRVVHSCGCEYAAKIMLPELFTDLFDALGQGYREGGCCLGGRNTEKFDVTKAAQQQVKSVFATGGCSCCGYTRRVERAHICPRAMGGAITIPLCPNCHQLYDEGQMTADELRYVVGRVRDDFGDSAADEVCMFHGAVRHSRRAT